MPLFAQSKFKACSFRNMLCFDCCDAIAAGSPTKQYRVTRLYDITRVLYPAMTSATNENKEAIIGNKEMSSRYSSATMENTSQSLRSGYHSGPQATPVQWNDDRRNPHNWPAARKYTLTILLSVFSFNTLMCSTMVAPALSQIRKDLNIATDAEAQLVLSIYVLAYAVGYFLWAPLSEVYGRKSILHTANTWFCIWNLVCGFSKNEATITVARLLSGCGAASSLALATGIMGEIWRPVQRGRSLAVLSTITVLGPCIGPIVGGAITQQSLGAWRWVFWSTSIFNALLQLISLRFLYESHSPTILRPRERIVDLAYNHSKRVLEPCTTAKVLMLALKRPLYLVVSQPASQGLVVYSGISFGSMYTVLSVIPIAFSEIYGQSLIIASLNYIAFAIGTTIAAQSCAPIMDFLYQRKAQQHANNIGVMDVDEALRAKGLNHKPPPEVRLYPFIPTVLLTAGGLLLFGWSLHFRNHWMVPNVGIALVGAGSQAMTQCTNAYVIDIFSEIQSPSSSDDTIGQRFAVSINWSSSAMASIWATKSLGGFAFPLFAVDLIRRLGWGWTGTLLAMLNITVGLAVTILLLVHGPKLRETGRKRIELKMLTTTI